MSDITRPLTVAELANRWSCSRRHIYNLIDRGELHIFRAGGTLRRISAETVRQWENAGSPTGSEPTGSASSTDKPSPHGETAKESIASGSAQRAAKTRRDANSIRSHMRRLDKSRATAGTP
jgi:excisionase family DNA binding protein